MTTAKTVCKSCERTFEAVQVRVPVPRGYYYAYEPTCEVCSLLAQSLVKMQEAKDLISKALAIAAKRDAS